jgi:hypothetical protein
MAVTTKIMVKDVQFMALIFEDVSVDSVPELAGLVEEW